MGRPGLTLRTPSSSTPSPRGIMPGLYCPSSWTPLPLTDSWVRACANGPCLSLRARLTYHNPQPQPVDGETRAGRRLVESGCRARSDAACANRPSPRTAPGVFVYPLAEAEVVSGFEAEAAGRRVSFQLQSRRRSQASCCTALGPALGASMPRRCARGEYRTHPRPRLQPHSGSCPLSFPSLLVPVQPRIFLFIDSSVPLFNQSWTGHLMYAKCWDSVTHSCLTEVCSQETDKAASSQLSLPVWSIST